MVAVIYAAVRAAAFSPRGSTNKNGRKQYKFMQNRERLGSRLGFIMLSAGCAIGCGNVWKFPWMCGQNGGGSFMLLYIICLVVLGLPAMTMEFSVGRADRPALSACTRSWKSPAASGAFSALPA